MILHRFACMLNKHAPKRSTTEWDGLSYVGNCRHCGARLRRISRGRWGKDRGIAPPVAASQAAPAPQSLSPTEPPHSSG